MTRTVKVDEEEGPALTMHGWFCFCSRMQQAAHVTWSVFKAQGLFGCYSLSITLMILM